MTTEELSVSAAILARHSIRSFLPTQVEQEKLMQILTAGQWVASGANQQPWRFVVCTSPDARSAICDALTPGNAEWARTAPVLMVVCARPEDSRFHNKEGKQYYLYECGLAVQNMILQATGLGLMARQMGGWSEDAVQPALGIPAEFRVVIVVAMGYEGSADQLPEQLRAREAQPRTRRDLSESVYWDRWQG